MNATSDTGPKRRHFKAIGRIVLGLAVALMIVVLLVIALFIAGWLHSDATNTERLHELQSDSLLRCHVSQITPWHAEDSNEVGTTHGIGFGGTAPTAVARDFYLNSADPPSVMSTLLACAQQSGWKMSILPGANQQDTVSATGVKTFPGGWQATLDMGVERHAPFASQPIVQIVIQTDAV